MLELCHIGGMAEPTLDKCFPVHSAICHCLIGPTPSPSPMPESALFTNRDRPPSLDIVYMTGTEISSCDMSRDGEQCPKTGRHDVQPDRILG